ncbi:MAG: tRNA (guanosine(46)-N7)-methyltransferase TrmB [Balneolaceae bacterium]
MGKNKLQRYSENKTLENVLEHTDFKNQEPPAGTWSETVFGNQFPITLELACGKGEYTINLAKRFKNRNFVGVDIKGDRIWKGAKRAFREHLTNVRFLRCYIDHLDQFFGKSEIHEIWITFPDPFLKKSDAKKRLTSPKFLDIYRRVARPDALVHLKTDSEPLFRYTQSVIREQRLTVDEKIEDVYTDGFRDGGPLAIQTYYEKKHLEDQRTIRYIRFLLNSVESL